MQISGGDDMATVIFDLDGTLADTSADLIAAANAVFRARGHGRMLEAPGDAAVALRGGRAMLRLGYGRLGAVDEARVDADYPDLLSAYATQLCNETRAYPGAEAAIAALAAAGYASVVCTNKPEALAEALLASLGLRRLFEALIGADTLAVRKPDAEPLREAVRRAGGDPDWALMVGDTRTDLDAARAAGLPCALVTFGPGGREPVAALAPDALLDDFAALPDLAADLLGPPHGRRRALGA